jgi:FKBP-type peptidyl-prolyl cis-trans isomerase
MSPRDDQVKKVKKQAAKAAKMTGAAFLSLAQAEMQQAARAAEEGVEKTTESGLKYVDTKVGDGASPVPGDTVRVHYTGWLEGFESEKKFDSSYDRRSPLVFRVGTGQVIKGWDEALLTDMKVGTVRNVIIPAALGYGARGAGGVIPPGATLYFKMELVGIGAR